MSTRVSELVVKAGLLRPEQMELARHNRSGLPAVEYAVRQGWCTDEAVGRLLAQAYGVPYLDLTSFDLPLELVSLIPPELLVKHQCVPVDLRDGALVLAMANPSNIYAQDDVRFLTGYNVEVVAAGPAALRDVLGNGGHFGSLALHAEVLGHSLRRTGVLGLREWVVGPAFAFHPASATIRFLRDGEEHALGEAAHARSSPIQPAAPCALFTDRELYGPGAPVRVGLLCPESAGQRVQVSLRTGRSPLPPLEVEVDANGLGWLSWTAPPPGSYVLEQGEASASFTVAAYGLSALQVQWHVGRREGDTLEGELRASVLGAPLEGTLAVTLLSTSVQPPRRLRTERVRTDASGRGHVQLPLGATGEVALEVQVEGRAELTATVLLPGAGGAAREPLLLSQWGETRVVDTVPFEGSTPFRGLHVGSRPDGGAAPLRIAEVTQGQVHLEVTGPVLRGVVVAVAADGRRFEVSIPGGVAGERFTLPLHAPWTLLLAGVVMPGGSDEWPRCWEGRAAVLAPALSLAVEVPERVRPGETVTLTLRGSPGASGWVSVRDARLTARRAGDATAAALWADLSQKLGPPLEDGELTSTLDSLFPWVSSRRHGPFLEELVCYDDGLGAERVREEQEEAPPSLAEEPPAVVLCQQVWFGEDGVARVDFQAPRLRGFLEVDVLEVLHGDWAGASASMRVHAAVHGELLLPRYVSEGERAVGTLLVALDAGEAEVVVRHRAAESGRAVGPPLAAVNAEEAEGAVRRHDTESARAVATPLVVVGAGRDVSATRVRLSAPGGEVRFDATAGHFEAEVRASSGEVLRVSGAVEHPGRATWLERSVVALAPGERLDIVGRDARARVTPGTGAQARRMAHALKDYAYACAEQTSAILIACISELLLGSDRRHELTRHLAGLVDRLGRMATRSGPFRAYPDSEVNTWLSEAAAAHLMELEWVEPGPVLKAVWPLVLRARSLGQRAAEAHGLLKSISRPHTARQALACIRRSPERASELAAQVLASVGVRASSHLLESEVRAETAYGAAVLLRAGPDFLPHALPLVRTALGGLEESGRCYSTLDSVAALALLASLQAGASANLCAVDGEKLPLSEASQRTARRHVEALDGPLFVELERLREEDLRTLLRGDMAGTARLELRGDGPPRPGDSLELVVRLDSGYCAGDLLQVFLPPALAWLHGGAQARGFSLDFEGRDELRVPLVVTAATEDAAGQRVPQRCGVFLRNMYDARRGSAFDALAVDTGGPGVLQQRVKGLPPPKHLQATQAA